MTDDRLYHSFWDINYIDVYQKPDSPKPSSTTSATFSTALLNAISIATSLPSVDTTALPSPSNTRTIMLTTATPSSAPTKSGGGVSDPAMLNGYTLLVCFGSSSGYPT
ncbi:Endo-1-3(4)-beta-glucanase [Apiospora phragmitis]|uniref:Endo-1-3(4)-beta-glucanase n=1 Tax=Apiospora phragmitis TaxID=2905665 RepID=A0ABR1T959_9PEZI